MECARAEEPSSARRSTGMSRKSGITVSMSFSCEGIISLRMDRVITGHGQGAAHRHDERSADPLNDASMRALQSTTGMHRSVHPCRLFVDSYGRLWTCDGYSDARPTPIRYAAMLSKPAFAR